MNSKRDTAIFAAGCFWGVEQTFAQTEGVLETEVGYTGGHKENPTYKEVCRGDSGHAEAVKVIFDPNKISYSQLLDVFWALHNPTMVNAQGPDIGHQYRSAIFYINEKQREEAEAAKKNLEEKQVYSKPIATEVNQASTFYRAEEYHQKYLEKHKGGTCHI